MKNRRWWFLATVLAGASILALLFCHRRDTAGLNSISMDAEANMDTDSRLARTRSSPRGVDMSNSRTIARTSKALGMLFAIDDSIPMFHVPDGWSPPEPKAPPEPPRLPVLKSTGSPSEKLADAVRWFESLPKGKKPSPQEWQAEKARMARAGMELAVDECRQGICRFSFTYNERNSTRPPTDFAQIRQQSWSFTIIAPDGRPEAHIFLVNPDRR